MLLKNPKGGNMFEEDVCLEKVYSRPDTLLDVKEHYCPGCGHGVAHKVLMEVVQELDIEESTIGVAPVGLFCLCL